MEIAQRAGIHAGQAKYIARFPVILLTVVLLLAPPPPGVRASCNQIPGTMNIFRGAVGTLDRPFAGPGDFVQLRLSPVCDAASARFAKTASDHVVTVVFKPPHGPRTVVAIAGDCSSTEASLSACEDRPDVFGSSCIPIDDTGGTNHMELVDREGVRFLRFRFPDTDPFLDAPDDGHTLAGPAAIAVTHHEAPLPCDLAASPCRANGGLVACVDELFAVDGTCDANLHETFPHFTALPPPNDFRGLCEEPSPPCTGEEAELRFALDAGGNILLPVDWRGVLLGESVPVARLLRGSASVEAFPGSGRPVRIPGAAFLRSFSPQGGQLPPIFEPQNDPSSLDEVTLFGSADADATVLRIARRGPAPAACREGGNEGLPCASDDDCPDGSCGPATCAGGPQVGEACAIDADCPQSECGPALFDFESRIAGGIGPVILSRFGAGVCEISGAPCANDSECADDRCVTYRMRAREPVALEGLMGSSELLLSVVPEELDGRDLNADGDAVDDVLMVFDRPTGRCLPIGYESSDGRAVTRVREGAFTFPAADVQNDLLAFLEPEPHQGRRDLNDDGDLMDTVLRVFRGVSGGIEERSGSAPLVADAAPRINGRSVVISGNRVFFRTAESASAGRRIERVSVSSAGVEANGQSVHPSLSSDGLHVAFESDATNLAPGAPTGQLHAYVRDLDTGETIAVQLEDDRLSPDTPARDPAISGDGRFVVVTATDSVEGHDQSWAYDRDPDDNGIREPDVTLTTLMSTDINGVSLGGGDTRFSAVSPDGSFVTFVTTAHNLTLDWANPTTTTMSHYRDPDQDGILDEPRETSTNAAAWVIPGGIYGNRHCLLQAAPISANGKVTAFASFADNLVDGDTNDFCFNLFPDQQTSVNCADVFVFVYKRKAYRVSVGTRGEQGNQASLTPAMSQDGWHVAFQSFASNLVPGDTNGVTDVFVRDRLHESTSRISVSSTGEQADGSSFDRTLAMSGNGRYVAFASRASNLVANDSNFECDNDIDGVAGENCFDVFVHDRVTGFTERVSVGQDGAQGNGRSSAPSISADGLTVAFHSRASNLVPGDHNDWCDNDHDGIAEENCSDIFVVGPDLADGPRVDLNDDGDPYDTVLRVLDAQNGEVTTLCPAEDVAVAGDTVVFLRPEWAGGGPLCPAGADFNEDGDSEDLVVHLWQPGELVRNLGQAAIVIAASEEWIAAIVRDDPDASVPNGSWHDLRFGDVFVYSLTAPDAEWRQIGANADLVRVTDSNVAFTVPVEARYTHRNLYVYDATTDEVLPVITEMGERLQMEDVVAHGDLVVFRSDEADGNGKDLNGDGRPEDLVLRIYDVANRRLINTGQAAIPCFLEACDPRVPYRVGKDTVSFLTLEVDQNEDLNGDGDQNDLVLQTFNVRFTQEAPAAALPGVAGMHSEDGGGADRTGRHPRTRMVGTQMQAGALTTVAAVTAGVCTNSGRACVDADDCEGGQCYLPPGGCVRDLARECDPTALVDACTPSGFCVPGGSPGAGRCHERLGDCSSDADCPASVRCMDGGRGIRRLVAPFSQAADGSHVFASMGQCFEKSNRSCASDNLCPAGFRCLQEQGGAEDRFCHRRHGSCLTGADCPSGTDCRNEFIVAAAADADSDEIADPFDNCPEIPNVDQADRNLDGVGDGCAAAPASPTATSLPTVTPSGTSEPAPATETPSRTSTRTEFPTRTSTAQRKSSDGCSTAGSDQGGGLGALALLAVAVVPYLLRRRFLLTMVLLGLCTTVGGRVAAETGSCAGDCDRNGRLTIDELTTGINLALGTLGLEKCPQFDADAGGTVGVDEVIQAVRSALEGCPGPVEIETVTAVNTLTRTLSEFAFVFAETVNWPNVVGGETCPLGGVDDRDCEVLDDGLVRIPFSFDECTHAAEESLVRLDGTFALVGTGFCPGVFLPANVGLEFEMTTTVLSSDGTPVSATDFDVSGKIEVIEFGPEPCILPGLKATVHGSTTFRAAGETVVLGFDDLDFSLSYAFLEGRCRSVFSTFDWNQDLRVSIDNSGQARSVTARTSELELVLSAGFMTGPMVTIDGQLALGCPAVTAELETVDPLVPVLGVPCPVDGELAISRMVEPATVHYGEDGRVDVDLDTDGATDETYRSCIDLPGISVCTD